MLPFFQVLRIEVHYWMVDKPEAFSADIFPTFKGEYQVHGAEDVRFYGLPIIEYPGLLKVSEMTILLSAGMHACVRVPALITRPYPLAKHRTKRFTFVHTALAR